MFLFFYSLDSDGEMKGSSKLGTSVHVLLKYWTWQGRVGDNIIILTSGIEDLFN